MKNFVCDYAAMGAKLANLYTIGEVERADKLEFKTHRAALHLWVIYNYNKNLTPFTAKEYSSLKTALQSIVPSTCFDSQQLVNTQAINGNSFILTETTGQDIITQQGDFLIA
jgi:hypothetical protein